MPGIVLLSHDILTDDRLTDSFIALHSLLHCIAVHLNVYVS